MSLNISSNLVPQVVNNYNAYTGDDKMIGLADEVTLPKIKNKTTTVNGMGIGGDVDSPVPGQFESMEATLTWNTLYSYATKMLHPGRLCADYPSRCYAERGQRWWLYLQGPAHCAGRQAERA